MKNASVMDAERGRSEEVVMSRVGCARVMFASVLFFSRSSRRSASLAYLAEAEDESFVSITMDRRAVRG